MSKFSPTQEQLDILTNNKKSLVVSASAGSGKTTVLVEYIKDLICKQNVPVKKLLVLTFTNVAGGEMKERLLKALSEEKQSKFLLEQIDDLPTADICTIDSFCEKVIKRNIDKLELSETFSVLDESESQKYRRMAFDDAFAMFLESDFEEYAYIYSCFKKNKNSIFECLIHIENFLDCLKYPNQLINKILNKQEDIFNESCQILQEYYQANLQEEIGKLNTLGLANANEKYIKFGEELKSQAIHLCQKDLFEMVKVAKDTSLPSLPTLKPQEKDEKLAKGLSNIKDAIKKVVESLWRYNFDNPILLSAQKEGKLAKALIKLYNVYKDTYQTIKKRDDTLDFSDIERLCSSLLENEDILKGLQENYEYTFIDEYQDTNFLQEGIIKKIASKNNFVAVGDPKQAIYGFRNATMEIMKKDISTNLKTKDGNVVYLRGNFRSDKRVLDFVNSIFSVLMKDENTGIDYASTSMLDGQANYYIDSDKAVEVCFLQEQEEERQEHTKVYSVKEASLTEKNKDKLEVDAICSYIDQMLAKKIYDIKQECWRDVELGDIVVLMRSRGSLMQTLATTLQTKGYPVLADDKEILTDSSEIQMLINFLQVCLDEKDEVAFVSALLSKLGGMSVQEISQIASSLEDKEKLLDKLFVMANPKATALKAEIERFKKEVMIYGIRRAFEFLFDRHDYFAYLEFLGEEQKIERFLSLISKSGFDKNIASLLSYLSNLSADKVDSGESDGNAIRIMTIHGSKGMEFPIVILAGCGKNISSPNRTSYEITERLGLSTMEYDRESLTKVLTPNLEASRVLKKKREYIDELMIFYVALTRAKNKLILTGTYDLRDYNFGDSKDFFKGKCYYDWLAMSLTEREKQEIVQNELYENSLAKFMIVDEVEDLKQIEKENLVVEEDKALTKKVEEYLDFVYPNLSLSKVEFKNSVTGLLKLQIDDKEIDKEDLIINKNKGFKLQEGYSASEVGTIYHEALRLLDFEKIEGRQDLVHEIGLLCENNFLTKEEKNVLNIDILFENIKILQKLTKNKRIFKEKPFIMKIKLNQITKSDLQERVLVQGVVDMFALGEENILVDYKYTSINNKEKILEKYSKQLSLYSKAIEKAYKIKLNKKYILSLKNCNLIEYFEN